MRELELTPSAALPDYLKAELKVGEAGQWPLVSAIDESLAGLAAHAFLKAFDLAGATASLPRRKQELQAIGLGVDALEETQREEVFAKRHAILSARGTLHAVELLAEIYFPGAGVTRGLPHARSRMGRVSQIRLANLADRRQVVFVRTVADYPSALCEEFLTNVDRLLPLPFEAMVAFPIRPQVPAVRWCLSSPRSWEKRRVACLTSRK